MHYLCNRTSVGLPLRIFKSVGSESFFLKPIRIPSVFGSVSKMQKWCFRSDPTATLIHILKIFLMIFICWILFKKSFDYSFYFLFFVLFAYVVLFAVSILNTFEKWTFIIVIYMLTWNTIVVQYVQFLFNKID